MGKQKNRLGTEDFGLNSNNVHRNFNSLKRKSGITLIALIITIIVLLILAGITIALVVRKQRGFKSSSKCSR